MGEYALYNGKEIKIGTCETMYYLRWDQRHLVEPIKGNVNPALDSGLRFRLPWPDEDHIEPGQFSPFERFLPLPNFFKYEDDIDIFLENPGTFQTELPGGVLANIKCYHGLKLPEENNDIRFFFNGKHSPISLRWIKDVNGEPFPVVGCQCGREWITSWEVIFDVLNDGNVYIPMKYIETSFVISDSKLVKKLTKRLKTIAKYQT